MANKKKKKPWEKLRDYRNLLSMSQSELAKKIGCDPSAVSYWESGRKSPSGFLAAELERVTGIPMTEWWYQ